jgi:hypothetical protein
MALPHNRAALLGALIALTLLSLLPSASLATAPRQLSSSSGSWLDGQLKALDPNYQPSRRRMRHRKEAGEGEAAREETLHPNTQQVAVPEKAGMKQEDLAAKLEAEVTALWEENVEAPAGDESKAQAAVVKEDEGGAASTVTKLENKATDAPPVAVEAKSVNENVEVVEASEAHSGEREADNEKSKAERKKKSKYGRVSGLPTNCDKFTLPLSPSMLINLDHAEFFDDYTEVDINDAKRYKILRKVSCAETLRLEQFALRFHTYL